MNSTEELKHLYDTQLKDDLAGMGYMAFFWTIEGYDSGISGNRYGYARTLGLNTNKFYDASNYHAYMGMSVRCVKD